MTLKPHIEVISLAASLDATLQLQGARRDYPANMRGQFIKRKKHISLVWFKRAGFAWINNKDIA